MSGNKGEIATRPQGAIATEMSVNDMTDQVALIQNMLAKVMKKDVHYGKIDGCGDKPCLLQPGAQKIGLTFRLHPKYEINRTDFDDGHREYEIICSLYAHDGSFAGQGVGSATTNESKYKYRTQVTDNPVPSEYWDTRDCQLLGGSQFSARKVWTGPKDNRKQQWMIVEKIAHENPADYYNTVLKISKKRSYVDAIQNSTACSDVFDQDTTDPDAIPQDDAGPTPKPPLEEPQSTNKPAENNGAGNVRTITEKQGKLIYARCKAQDMSDAEMEALVFGISKVKHSSEIPADDMDAILKAIEEWERVEGDPALPYT